MCRSIELNYDILISVLPKITDAILVTLVKHRPVCNGNPRAILTGRSLKASRARVGH